MRRFFLAASLVLSFLAAMPSAYAQQAPTQAQLNQAQAILAQYPNGGTALQDAIAAAVEQDPALASAFASAAANATPAIQASIGTGLAQAANFFANQGTSSGTSNAETVLNAINNSGNTTLIASAAASISPTAGGLVGTNTALALALNLNATTNTGGQTSCVSPSRPGPC